MARDLTSPEPIAVEIIVAEDDSCQLQFYARGHHDRAAFLRAVQAYIEREHRDIRLPACAVVRPIHWRKVPVRDHYVVEHVMHESGPGRGAFAVTLLDEWFPLHAYVKAVRS